MFRDPRALVQSILADTWIGPMRQRGDADLVMTQCVPPSHHIRKKLQADLDLIKSSTK